MLKIESHWSIILHDVTFIYYIIYIIYFRIELPYYKIQCRMMQGQSQMGNNPKLVNVADYYSIC